MNQNQYFPDQWWEHVDSIMSNIKFYSILWQPLQSESPPSSDPPTAPSPESPASPTLTTKTSLNPLQPGHHKFISSSLPVSIQKTTPYPWGLDICGSQQQAAACRRSGQLCWQKHKLENLFPASWEQPTIQLRSIGLLRKQLHLLLIQEEMRELLPFKYRHLLRVCFNPNRQPRLLQPGNLSQSWGGGPTLGQQCPSWMEKVRKARATAKRSTMRTTLTPSQSTPPSMRWSRMCAERFPTALTAESPPVLMMSQTPRWTSTAPRKDTLASVTAAEPTTAMKLTV